MRRKVSLPVARQAIAEQYAKRRSAFGRAVLSRNPSAALITT